MIGVERVPLDDGTAALVAALMRRLGQTKVDLAASELEDSHGGAPVVVGSWNLPTETVTLEVMPPSERHSPAAAAAGDLATAGPPHPDAAARAQAAAEQLPTVGRWSDTPPPTAEGERALATTLGAALDVPASMLLDDPTASTRAAAEQHPTSGRQPDNPPPAARDEQPPD